jgi:hypothetical protein
MRAFAEAWQDEDLCSRLLHNCPGFTIACCSTSSSPMRSVLGTPS